jgi:hypothetical protein
MAFFSFLYGRDEEEEKKVNESAKKNLRFRFFFFVRSTFAETGNGDLSIRILLLTVVKKLGSADKFGDNYRVDTK